MLGGEEELEDAVADAGLAFRGQTSGAATKVQGKLQGFQHELKVGQRVPGKR